MENMEFIENIDDNVEKGKSPANIKGKRTKVPTKAELKDCTSPDMFSSDLHKAAHLDGM